MLRNTLKSLQNDDEKGSEDSEKNECSMSSLFRLQNVHQTESTIPVVLKKNISMLCNLEIWKWV